MQIKDMFVIGAALIALSGCVSPSGKQTQNASSAQTSISVWTQNSSTKDIHERIPEFDLGSEVVVVISGIALNPHGPGMAGVAMLSEINNMMVSARGVQCVIEETSGKQVEPSGRLRFWSNSARKQTGNEAITGFGGKWPAGEFKVILRDRTGGEVASCSFKVRSR